MQAVNLFPTPVAIFSLERDLTPTELEIFTSQERRDNTGNTTSIDSYILNKPELEFLKQFIEASLIEYAKEFLNSSNDFSLRITQSWANYTQNNQYHHKHSHPNSVLSGVFYVKTDPTKDRIMFYNPKPRSFFQLQVDNFNIYNSASWWLEALPNRLMIFPSELEHSVEPLRDYQEERISLSFNTFYKGIIGIQRELTELIID